MSEPILRPEDERLWRSWVATCRIHARQRDHQRRVDLARRRIGDALAAAPSWCVMWSGGKDSTALVHLACVDLGHRLPVASEKDDLDYPGEEEYVLDLAAAWGLDLAVLRPPVSPRAWMAENAATLGAGDDLHSRAAGLSRACFYDVVERHGAAHDGVMLGLRQEESAGRRASRAAHGTLYRKAHPYRAAGQWVSTPLADWTGLDVMAYLLTRTIPVLPVYRCLALAHAREPWRLRKSWWVPGGHSRWGGAAWLRHYYPSLYHQLAAWMPDAGAYT